MDKLYKWNTKEYNFIELSSGRRSALRARLKKLVQMTKKFFLLSLWIIPRRARFLYNNKKIPTVSFRSDCSRRKEKKLPKSLTFAENGGRIPISNFIRAILSELHCSPPLSVHWLVYVQFNARNAVKLSIKLKRQFQCPFITNFMTI